MPPSYRSVSRVAPSRFFRGDFAPDPGRRLVMPDAARRAVISSSRNLDRGIRDRHPENHGRAAAIAFPVPGTLLARQLCPSRPRVLLRYPGMPRQGQGNLTCPPRVTGNYQIPDRRFPVRVGLAVSPAARCFRRFTLASRSRIGPYEPSGMMIAMTRGPPPDRFDGPSIAARRPPSPISPAACGTRSRDTIIVWRAASY